MPRAWDSLLLKSTAPDPGSTAWEHLQSPFSGGGTGVNSVRPPTANLTLVGLSPDASATNTTVNPIVGAVYFNEAIPQVVLTGSATVPVPVGEINFTSQVVSDIPENLTVFESEDRFIVVSDRENAYVVVGPEFRSVNVEDEDRTVAVDERLT